MGPRRVRAAAGARIRRRKNEKSKMRGGEMFAPRAKHGRVLVFAWHYQPFLQTKSIQ